MKAAAFIRPAVPLLLSAGAVVLGIWIALPWPMIGVLGIVAVGALSVAQGKHPSRRDTTLVWLASLTVFGCALFCNHKSFTLGMLWAALALLNAVALFVASDQINEARTKKSWKIMGLTWGFFGGIVWLAHTYGENLAGKFYIGVMLNVTLLFLTRASLRPRPAVVQMINTCLLLVVGLPIADLLMRAADKEKAAVDPRQRHYSYEYARRDPEGFAAWHTAYLRQLRSVEQSIFEPDVDLNRHLRPNSHGTFFKNRITINSNGFRGREISPEKGNAYRIVALGESTTFGITMNADDRPWPELLEEIIRQRLKTDRTVEVINAGVPGYTLRDNLQRLAADILPLKPDLIVSYHGANGFKLISKALPQTAVKEPPSYHPRPLKLLADCEYRLRISRFNRRQAAELAAHPPVFSDPMTTECARVYRQLIEVADTNGVRLALANYSMAVNGQSDPRVIEFYRGPFPQVNWWIKVNAIHSQILQQLTEQNPGVIQVNTHPGLDGAHEKFIDLIHFSPEGERQMAETVFTGLKNVLEAELTKPVE